MKKIIRNSIFSPSAYSGRLWSVSFFLQGKPAIIVIQKQKVEKGDVTTEVTATGSVQPVDEIEVGYSSFWIGQ